MVARAARAAVAAAILVCGCTTATNTATGLESISTTADTIPITSTLTRPSSTVAVTTSTALMVTTTTGTTTTTTSTTTTTTLPAREAIHLEVRTRESWGAKPPDRGLKAHVIDTLTVHHTARPHDDTPMEEKMQRWQNYHQSIGFGDIAYHMVVAADGTIYEGREYGFVGSTRTSYDPTGHFLPSLDGMFDEFWDNPNDDDDLPDGADDLSKAQLGALIDLLAWASVEFDVPPDEIVGHRDHAATACPGSLVHDMLQSGEIADRVRNRIESVDIELVYVP